MARKVIVDSGNSSTKVGVFQNDELVALQVFKSNDDLETFLKATAADALIISSVSIHVERLQSYTTHIPRVVVLNSETPVPVKNEYATPATLGVDRIAAVCGARIEFPDQNCLVIDAGTCVTYEILTASGIYLGGAITPGLAMRLKAMHTFTARLPEVEVNPQPLIIGNSTQTCLQTGALIGLAAEMEGMIARYSEIFPDLKVILCGGDTPLFENRLKGTIFAVPELVLSGLNSILNYNVRIL